MNWYKKAKLNNDINKKDDPQILETDPTQTQQVEEYPQNEEVAQPEEVITKNYYTQGKENQDSKTQWEYSEEAMYDFFETEDETIVEQVEAFNRSKPGERQPWRVAPLARIKRIWADFARTGFVRDERGLELIEDIFLENIKKVRANTLLAGHSSVNPERYLSDLGYKLKERKKHDYGDWILDDKGQWRISDYALSDLTNGALELMSAKTPEEKLLKLDFILTVAHQRSDIASWFIEKGYKGLQEIQNQIV